MGLRYSLDSLRSRLILLVVLSLLPPIGLTIYGARRERQHAINVAESDLQRLTALAAASEAKSIEGVRQFLIALSDMPTLRQDPESCGAMLRTMLKKNPGYLNLGVLDLNGDLLCSAIPSTNAVNLSDRSNVRKTIATGKFATGDYVFGRVVRKAAINASYPIFDADDKIVAVVFASLDLSALDQFASDIEFPPNAVLITADGNGTIIARKPDPERWVGTRAAPELFDVMVKVRFGTAEITGADGIARLHAIAPVGGPDISNFTVSIGIPTADIVAAANHEQATELVTLMLTAALALVTAWFVANVTIIDRVRALVDAARRIADGHFDTRTGIRYGREEISELARAFDRMADSLQRGAVDREDAQARLYAEKERAQVTLESIGDAVITTNRAGRIDYMNPVAETLTGWSAVESSGKPLSEVFNVINGSTREVVPNVVSKTLEQGRVDGMGRDSILISRDGTERAIEDSVAPIRDREHAIVGTVLVFHDVSHSRNLARQLSHQASHDPLTGLVNRREFERRLQLLVDQSDTQARQHALLFLDLDRFKAVNDACGHNAGDELLRQVTALLQPLLRDSDTLARVGGDEFAALLENCTPVSAARIADKLCKTVCEFRFAWHDQIFPIGVSIGLVNFSSSKLDMAALLAAADRACYRAKDAGRNRVHQFTPEERDSAAQQGESAWRSRIQHAIDHQRFLLLSQEVRSLGALGRPVPHYELLLRMLDEAGNQVLPSAFTPAAERYGLMPAIERWVMRRALTHHAALLRAGPTDTPPAICALPLSASALNDNLFIGFLKDLFAETRMPPGAICFEIAETTAIANLSRSLQLIDALKPLGCLFALDDFGSGMSSFAYLAHLRVDFLKIDGAYIMDMANDPIDRAKVEAINHVSHAMGIRTIAKHVEDQQTIDRLRAIRVDLAQGVAISPAVLLPEPAPSPSDTPA